MESSESKDYIPIDRSASPSQSRPLSGGVVRTRPGSAISSSRPRSALNQNPATLLQLKEVDNQIRKITKQIKVLQRERIVKEYLDKLAEAEENKKEETSRPTTRDTSRRKEADNTLAVDINENSIDPILDLEDDRHKHIVKYESLSGESYQPSPEAMIWDFCELFFEEFHQPPQKRFKDYIYKYYDPAASLNIVGFKTFTSRDNIVNVLLKRYDGLTVQHKIRDVKPDSEAMPGSVLSGNVSVYIKIDDDEPRKVLHMMQFVKSKELGPFDYVLKKEFFVVQDARPLYHFAEEPPPLSSIELEIIRIKEQRLQEERERELKELEAEGEGEDEGDEEGSLGEGSQSIVSGSLAGSKAGGNNAESNKDGDNRSQTSQQSRNTLTKPAEGGSAANSVADSKTKPSIKAQTTIDDNDDLSVDSAIKSKS